MATEILSNSAKIQFGFHELDLEVPEMPALALVNHAEQISRMAACVTRMAGRFEDLDGEAPGTKAFGLEAAEFLSNLASALSGAAASELQSSAGVA